MSAVANQAIMNRPPRAAVVGAGIAGLSCATLLQSAGFEVGVFDKSRGPSGRMSTRRGDDWQCDHGAQYFTARNPDFRAEVARWQHAGVAASWRPRLHVLGDPSAHVPDPALERFVGVPRMSAPCRFLADGLGIEVGTSIRQLQRRPDGWHLLSAERGWLDRSFDVALLALPAPQAAPLLREAAPGLAALAGNVVMRGAWALMLRYLAAARQRRVERGASGRRRRPRPHDAATGLRRFGSSRRGTPGGAGVGDAPLALRRLRHQPGSPLPL
ncbi:MAG: dependent oxidoreductase [Proteobacteria bacterium]|nr:dependent oxidoreductase [Pseudomonadota bacterium]